MWSWRGSAGLVAIPTGLDTEGIITAFLKRMEVWHREKEELMPGCVCTWHSEVSIFSDRQMRALTECTVYFGCRGVVSSDLGSG